MNNSGKKHFKTPFLIAVLLLQFVIFSLPTEVFAQQAGTSAESRARCVDFQNQFKIDPNNIDPEHRKDPGILSPVTEGIPPYCTAFEIIGAAMRIIFTLAGAVSVLFIMAGGFWYMTSGGNDEQAEKGKKVLTNAVLGLVLVLLSATIMNILINTITGKGFIGGSGSPANGTGSNNGTQVGNTDPGTVIQNLVQSGNFQVSMQPEVVTPASVVSFTATFPSTSYDALKTKCGGEPNLKVRLAGNNLEKTAGFIQSGNTFYATAQFSPGSIKTNDTAEFSICGNQLSQTLQVQLASDFGSGGSQLPKYSDSEIQAAAGRASYSTTKTSSGFNINITAASTDVNIMCGNLPSGEQRISFYLNDQFVNSAPITVRQQRVTLDAGSSMPTVRVNICGSEISGG